ncbi:MAG: hypothetical protein AAF492_18300, partial [Verrucomicrobiota bacterium]
EGEAEQALISPILPFGEGECYACMAETFGFAFGEPPEDWGIGDLTREKVLATTAFMESHGFRLKRVKTENSI